MKRILTIQDVSCVGKTSLTVALPIISAMGVEACILPTAVLSTHTMYTEFTFRDLTSDIIPICEDWKKKKFTFDAIYTGYLGSFEQLELMKMIIREFGSNSLIIIDPCMGDGGQLYQGFSKEFPAAMAGLCSFADIITPNMTEASLLLDIPYIEKGYTLNYVKDILVRLTQTGAKKVVLKGLQFTEAQPEIGDQKNKLGIMAYDKETKQFSWYFHEKMPESFHGTGDIFASVLTGAIMRGKTFQEAYTLAGDFVVKAIKATLSHADHNIYGVDFETVIPYLISKLS